MSEKKVQGATLPADLMRREVKKIESRFEILRTILSLVIALAIVLVIVAFVSKEPLEAIKTLLLGPLSSVRRFADVVQLMIPLSFCGLAITMVFKTKRYNLSADSAFFMGLMVATIVGCFSPFPPFITIILALVLGYLVGCLIGFIPAILGEKFYTDPLVISLMLNYVVGFFVNYLFNYVVRDPYKANMQSLPLQKGVNLGALVPKTRIHYGLFIMIACVVICYIILYKTKKGYAVRMTGENEKFARYVSIPVGSVIVGAQTLGTGLAGLGGAVEMIGAYTTFKWQMSPAYGFDGVILATLARNNPLGVPFAAFFLAYIRVGADILNRTSDIPAEIVSVVQATVILLIAAQAFLSRWKQRAIVKKADELNRAAEAN